MFITLGQWFSTFLSQEAPLINTIFEELFPVLLPLLCLLTETMSIDIKRGALLLFFFA